MNKHAVKISKDLFLSLKGLQNQGYGLDKMLILLQKDCLVTCNL